MIIGICSADHLRADRNSGTELWGGAGWARIGQYLPYYEAAGHTIVKGILWKRQGDGLYVQYAKDADTVRPDIILMQRLMVGGVDEAIRHGREHGQTIVNDVDDWFWGLHTSNAAFATTHPKLSPKENTEHYARALRASNVVTASTPYLQSRLVDLLKREVLLIPNYIDVSRFTPVVQTEGRPVLGWAGSSAHRSNDLETLRGIVKPFVDRGEYSLHHSGAIPTDDPFAHKIGCEPATTSPLSSSADYPSLLTFDVGLIPLNDNPFNRAKSYLKGLEYAAAGIPFVAQNLPEYQRLGEVFGDACTIAHRPKDWIKGLKGFIDYDRRIEAQAKLLDTVREFDIQFGAKIWTNLLGELI